MSGSDIEHSAIKSLNEDEEIITSKSKIWYG